MSLTDIVSLPQIIAGARSEGGALIAAIPDAWLQGRTAYGGLTAALALEAAYRSADDLPPLRSAQISFIGPAAGEVSVSTALLRRGRTAAFIEASVTSGEALAMKALFVFQADPGSSLDHSDMPAPDAPAPQDAAIANHDPGFPFFTSNFEYRHAAPKSDVRRPDLRRWVRLKDREGLRPMVELMAIGDALPPAAMALHDSFVPVSSLTWMINLLAAEPRTSDGWWLSRSTAEQARSGSSSQSMGLWSTSGTPVAAGMQSVALFG